MSRITPQKFIRKALYVDAVRVTNGNFNDIVEWCQGEVLQDEVPGQGTGKRYIKVRVNSPKNPRQTKAFVGDWLLYTERGYKVYTNKAFRTSFDEVGTEKPPYPYAEGDVLVLGPECFVAKDGSVMNWKGLNYVPQTFPDVVRVTSDLIQDYVPIDAEVKRQQVDEAA